MKIEIPSMTEAVSQYLAAAVEFNAKLPGQVSSSAVRDLAVKAMIVLYGYTLSENWGVDEKPKVPLPTSLAFDLADNISQVISGRIPTCIRHMQGVGRPLVLPQQERAMGLLVAWRKCCARGLIKDPAPTKTGARLYGVSSAAVLKWDKEYFHAEPEDFAPYARDEAEMARLIAEELPKAGLRYRTERGTTTTPPKRVDTKRRIKIRRPHRK